MANSINLRDEFLEKLRFANRSQATIDQYAPKLTLFAAFISENYGLSIDSLSEIGQVKGYMLHEYQKRLRDDSASPSLEMAHVSAIKSFFSWLDRFDYIDKNPSSVFLPIHVPKKEQAHFEWSEAEEIMNKYESWNTERDLAILASGFTMGLRASSIAELNIGDIGKDGEAKLSYVNKGGRRESMYVPSEVMEIVNRYVQRDRFDAADDAPLFISRNGNRVNRKTINDICKRGGESIGKRGTAHAMRRTCLSRINEVSGIEMAKNIARHSSESMTQRYLYSSKEHMDKLYSEMSLTSFSTKGELLT